MAQRVGPRLLLDANPQASHTHRRGGVQPGGPLGGGADSRKLSQQGHGLGGLRVVLARGSPHRAAHPAAAVMPGGCWGRARPACHPPPVPGAVQCRSHETPCKYLMDLEPGVMKSRARDGGSQNIPPANTVHRPRPAPRPGHELRDGLGLCTVAVRELRPPPPGPSPHPHPCKAASCRGAWQVRHSPALDPAAVPSDSGPHALCSLHLPWVPRLTLPSLRLHW